MYLLIINTEEKRDGYFDTALIKRPFPESHADCMANTCSSGFWNLNKFNMSWSLSPVFTMVMKIKTEIKVPKVERKSLIIGELL